MYNILIIGRSGNGKSSIARSIADCVGIKNANDIFVKEKEQREKYNIVHAENDKFKILDCSVIGDGDGDINMNINFSRIFAKEIVESCESKGGIAVVIFVLKYGVRFTKQEKDAVARIKTIFGSTIFEDLVVIAFSYGDLFKLDCDADENFTFNDWCIQQTGDIHSLFQEVKFRCVLFDNKIGSGSEQRINCRHLLEYVEYLDKETLNVITDVTTGIQNDQLIRRKLTAENFKIRNKEHLNTKDKQFTGQNNSLLGIIKTFFSR